MKRREFHRCLSIVANAGSGKTHHLVTRCIQLLHRNHAPEKILALTFTRKAAAEFLQKLFGRLAEAVGDDKAREALRRELVDCPALTADEVTAWMRQLLGVLPRLSMGTMDQYFGRIVRAFPFELGLSREMELLDEAAQEENLRRTLDLLFAREAGKKGGIEELIELLRQQSRNRSDQSALRGISQAASGLQEKFLETPSSIGWGRRDSIWPGHSDILDAPELEAAIMAFWEAVLHEKPDLGPTARTKCEEWFQEARDHRAPAKMSKRLETFVKKLGESSPDGLSFPIGNGAVNRIPLSGHVPAARRALRCAILKPELEARLSSSRALYDLLARYENIYDETVRQPGALTFADLVVLLARNEGDGWRRDMEYRLDGKHDDWLLDEFQDTSRLQWRVMDPLVEEIVSSTEGERTFFYVGDTKQAIYGWRGGDAGLFKQVLGQYNAHEKKIAEDELAESRRSDRSIVEVIASVFDPQKLEDPALAADFKIPAATVRDWKGAWVAHEALPEAGEGFASFQILERDAGREDEEEREVAAREVLRIIKEVDPIRRGIECAILVRRRSTLDFYVSLLRSQNPPVPVAAEGKINPCLNIPLGQALLSLAKSVASPKDEIAGAHFIASPLGSLACGDLEAFREIALREVAAKGFAETFRVWLKAEGAAGRIHPDDGEAFVEAAADFDAARQPGDDWRKFISFIEHRSLQESETPGVIRVMTVHGAKGLGMDMVILPELGGKNMTELRSGPEISLHRNSTGDVQWGLALPSKDICDADDTLKEARGSLAAKQAYEAFCVLYVAMTRARHGLYCLGVRGKKDFKNAGRWLEQTFPIPACSDGSVRELGDKNWFKSFKPGHDIPPGPVIEGAAIDLVSGELASGIAPSSHDGEDLPAGMILGGGAARHLGTEVHGILAQIEWLGEEPDLSRASKQAADLVRAFLASERASVLEKPTGQVRLWRESAFDVEVDGKPLSGVFDRLQVVYNPDGQPVSAHIYDFKTDRGPVDLREKYSTQLEAYARAAARLLGIPDDMVQAVPVAVRG